MKKLLSIAIILVSTHVSAHESQREAQLKATNDELTMRVAELLEQNARLEAFAKRALVAQSQERTVVVGCDVRGIRKTMVEGSGKPRVLKDWLIKHQSSCTTKQLQDIKKNMDSWTAFSLFDEHRLLEFYIEDR